MTDITDVTKAFDVFLQTTVKSITGDASSSLFEEEVHNKVYLTVDYPFGHMDLDKAGCDVLTYIKSLVANIPEIAKTDFEYHLLESKISNRIIVTLHWTVEQTPPSLPVELAGFGKFFIDALGKYLVTNLDSYAKAQKV